MRVLILGVKGNLGNQLIKVFNKGYEIVAWDKDEIDVTDKDLILTKVDDVKPDIIINATGYNAVDKCEENKDEFELAKKLNGQAVGYLSEAAINNKSVFINYSSNYIFAGDKKDGYYENDKPAPINNYGQTKLIGEQEIIRRSGSGLKWYLIRTSKLFGPPGISQITKPSFFDLMFDLSKEHDKLEVVDDEASCFTYTPDLAKATRQLAESGKGYGIYHIINSGSCTWYEAAVELFKIIGKKINIKPINSDEYIRSAKRPKYSILLNTKLEPLRNWKDALREYIENKDQAKKI